MIINNRNTNILGPGWRQNVHIIHFLTEAKCIRMRRSEFKG